MHTRTSRISKITITIFLTALAVFAFRSLQNGPSIVNEVPTDSVSKGIIENSITSTSTKSIIACPFSPVAADVLVVIKTGATEALTLLPTFFLTIGQCIPNVMVFSDLEQQIGDIQIYDALKLVSSHYIETKPEFEFYRNIQTIYQNFEDLTAFGQFDGNRDKAWTLDKWKNIPMIHEAHSKYPNVKWHIYIDADTFLGFTNILQTLQKFDHSVPLYMGAAHGANDWLKFAHGGTGYILSSAAITAFENIYTKENIEKWEAETAQNCCGDVMVGIAMKDAGVQLHSATPLMQVTTFREVRWQENLWCEPSWTWHHVRSHDLQQLYEFERIWYSNKKSSYRFKDLFGVFIKPFITETKDDWDNLSLDQSLKDSVVSSSAECCAACIEDQRCLQWTWKADQSCSHNGFIKLGHRVNRDSSEKQPQVVSGWILNRINALEEQWNQKVCRIR